MVEPERKMLLEQVEKEVERMRIELLSENDEREAEKLKRFRAALSGLVGYAVEPTKLEVELEGLRFCWKVTDFILVGNCPQCEARQEEPIFWHYPTPVSGKDVTDRHAMIKLLASCYEIVTRECMRCIRTKRVLEGTGI